MSDAVLKLAEHICHFLDTVDDMPRNEPLTFSVDIVKVGHGKYHLSQPVLAASQDNQIIQRH